MTEQTDLANRNQADAPGNSSASSAGLSPTDKPADQRRQDEVPLSAGTVSDGGAYQGGAAPGEAIDDEDTSRHPLDSREHFGGDGAQYVAPDEASTNAAPQRRGLLPGDVGYDEAAHPVASQEAE